MSALCRRARSELELARELARMVDSKVAAVRRGYQRELKERLTLLDGLLVEIERELWTATDDAPPQKRTRSTGGAT